MSTTTIEWTDETWNPTTGCDRVSPGCDHCYACPMAKRMKAMELQRINAGKLIAAKAKYQTDGDPRTSGPGFGIAMHEGTLTAPFSWSTPRKVFVNSMSDLFHKGVTDEFIARVFAVMAATPRHQYQILTKRHGRMRSLLGNDGQILLEATQDDATAQALYDAGWPLPNVWLGVSVEDQKYADLRIPQLLMTPAAVRFISAEPLLGPIDLTQIAWTDGGGTHLDVVNGRHGVPNLWAAPAKRLDWVIAGGESGPGYRAVDPAWIRQLRDQCTAADVAFLFKQWGGRTPKSTGRELDGRTWDEYPKHPQPASLHS